MNIMASPYRIGKFERIECEGQLGNRGNESSIVHMKAAVNMWPNVRKLTCQDVR
ncbi:hypothetical protein [Rhizobium mayense]|uniref:Uncharacterized protein n=1 Tax=Rhizobium mayense TaxID=1312184 RepID=A0ABT7JYB6_9HYPH|nr:hypothetical protein [Rhizobium mayense]MDL2401349.1 hypothetical protein [Rhizobium mayense]